MTGKVLRLGFFAFSLTPAGAQTRSPQHPLHALTSDEYWTVHDALEKSGRLTERALVSSLLPHGFGRSTFSTKTGAESAISAVVWPAFCARL